MKIYFANTAPKKVTLIFVGPKERKYLDHKRKGERKEGNNRVGNLTAKKKRQKCNL